MFTLLPPSQNIKVAACVVLFHPDREEYRLLTDTGTEWRLSTRIIKGECVDDVFRVQTSSGSTYDLNNDSIKSNESIDKMIDIFLAQGQSFIVAADNPKGLLQVLDKLSD